MKPVSLADITYEQGLELLSMRKEALDAGDVPRMSAKSLADSYFLRDSSAAISQEKRANSFMDGLKSVWKNPTGKATLIGGGLGALGGLGKTVMDDEDDSYLSNMLTGGVGGAAVGGAAGLAFDPKTRKGMADRIAGLAEDVVPEPADSSKKTPAQIAKERMGSSNNSNANKELLDARSDAQGFIPGPVVDKILGDRNTAANAIAAGTTVAPAGLAASYMKARPSTLADPVRAAVENPASLNFADPKLQDALSEGGTNKGFAANETSFKNRGKLPVRKDGTMEFTPTDAKRSVSNAYNTARSNINLSPDKINDLTPKQLAAYTRFKELADAKDYKTLDKMFKNLGIAPGSFSGETGMRNLDDIASSSEILGKKFKRFSPLKFVEDVASGGKGQVARHLRRLPKGRLAALVAAGGLGAGLTKELGLYRSAGKSTEDLQRRKQIFEEMKKIYESNASRGE